ncbi:hypothetical protein NQ318_017562 [Aromia moschata]|uniref:Hydin adenylate kinase-like domain-containing protein n=1 Tax=Aromia moschata TaxID=1265417 RepID=A0AAV8Z334_9CUCU|nr:hypothetical protein NQ318_017562 [Aromia moschata]
MDIALKDLKPLKAIIHGPPAAGKTRLANRLCNEYGAKYITVKTMIEETLEELRDNIAREQERLELKAVKNEKGEKEDVEEEEQEEEEEEDELGEEEEGGGIIEEWQEQIKYITVTMNQTADGKLPDEYVVRLMKTYLSKEFCRTRGYVLDGYPKTTEQAREIFGQAAEIPQMGEGGEGGVVPAAGLPGEGMGGEDQIVPMLSTSEDKIMPDFVISLQASDEFLCQRVMRLPQRVIQGTHYDEKNMLRRLAEFRAANTDENTMLKFFDEAEIHPILINLVDDETDNEVDFDCIYTMITDILGPPIPGLGLSPEELEELRRLEAEKMRLMMREYQIERKMKEEKAMREYQDKMERWAVTMEKLQMEEEKILAAQSEPLRFYLMKNVFPTLTQGLIEVARVKPDDPVDYLAEYLFRENPEGKMFDPAYTRDGERLLKQYEKDVAPTVAKNFVDDT